MSEERRLKLEALLTRLVDAAPGSTYPLDPLERELLIEEIERLEGIEEQWEQACSEAEDHRWD